MIDTTNHVDDVPAVFWFLLLKIDYNFLPKPGTKTFQVVMIDTVLLAGLAAHGEDTFGPLEGVDEVKAQTQLQWYSIFITWLFANSYFLLKKNHILYVV